MRSIASISANRDLLKFITHGIGVTFQSLKIKVFIAKDIDHLVQ